MNLARHFRFWMTIRKMIEPQQLQVKPFDNYFHVLSENYEFVTTFKPKTNLLYVHQVDTPAAVLKKDGLHLLPDKIPDLNQRQKFQAVKRNLETHYQHAYDKCKTGREIFHIQRKVKIEIHNKLNAIGKLQGKYKHLLAFKPLLEIQREKTIQEYEKKGVKVQLLNAQIFPSGEVWLPTNEQYIMDYKSILDRETASPISMLDIGCGSGVLSFLFAKAFKKAKVFGVDNNPNAVKTFNLNASRLDFKNAQAFQHDIKKVDQFGIISRQNGAPATFDRIVINPPWITANKLAGESLLADGVYDNKGAMLSGAFEIAKKHLSKEGKIILIYSDLSSILGLELKSVQQLCDQNNMLITECHEKNYTNELAKKSPLNPFKSKAKILTYEIRWSR